LHDQINREFFDNKLLKIRIKLEKRNVRNYGCYLHKVKDDYGSEPESAVIKIHVDCFSDDKLLLGTLVHEMIHQWQSEVAKVACDHGVIFQRKAKEAEDTYGVEV
jgi:hypothetical protein